MRSFTSAGRICGPVVVLAELGGVGNHGIHLLDAAVVDQIHDQLGFMHAFKIGHFRGITGFRQRFKAVLHQVHQTAAKHVLFAEQVFISFLGHRAFQHAAAGQAFCLRHRQGPRRGPCRRDSGARQ